MHIAHTCISVFVEPQMPTFPHRKTNVGEHIGRLNSIKLFGNMYCKFQFLKLFQSCGVQTRETVHYPKLRKNKASCHYALHSYILLIQ